MAKAQSRKSTALVFDSKKRIAHLEGYLFEREEIIRKICSAAMSSQRIIHLTLTICRRNPKLLECEPFSFVNALLDAAFFGIEPNPSLAEGYIVPFRNNRGGEAIVEAQFLAGYRGKRNLVINHGYATDVQPVAVYEKDEFKVARHLAWEGKAPFTHFEYPDGERGNLKAVYTMTTFENGQHSFNWLPRKGAGSIEFYRSKSRAAQDGPWIDSYDAMALKTVVHRTCEQLPRKPGSLLGAAIAHENTFEEGAPMHAYEFDEKTGEVTPHLAAQVNECQPPPLIDGGAQGALFSPDEAR
jgi:recombination protein RecT